MVGQDTSHLSALLYFFFDCCIMYYWTHMYCGLCWRSRARCMMLLGTWKIANATCNAQGFDDHLAGVCIFCSSAAEMWTLCCLRLYNSFLYMMEFAVVIHWAHRHEVFCWINYFCCFSNKWVNASMGKQSMQTRFAVAHVFEESLASVGKLLVLSFSRRVWCCDACDKSCRVFPSHIHTAVDRSAHASFLFSFF